MATVRYPSLYQINTRVWLTELSHKLGRPATLDDIPDAELDRLAQMGFDWVWLLSVWQTGLAARNVSRTNAEWRREFQETLSDLREDDIPGSGFAITGYIVHANLGGDAALARLRQRLTKRGLRLMLDFVPNHVALDHLWVEDHPEYFVRGTELDLARARQNYTWVKRKRGDLLLAHGRDPYFPGWPDTLQLNCANPATQEAMIGELVKIAGQCDGVRCDMAMLVLPEVFERTWGQRAPLFWPTATQRVRERVPERYVHLPRQAVLHPPVVPQHPGVTLDRATLAADETPLLVARLAVDRPLAVALADYLEARPQLPVPNPLQVVEYFIHPLLPPPMSFFLRLILLGGSVPAVVVIYLDKAVDDVALQLLLVILHGQHLIATTLHDLLGDLLRTTHGIDAHQRPVQVDQFQQAGNGRDLIRLLLHGHLPQSQVGLRRPGTHPVQGVPRRRAALGVPQSLAVDGDGLKAQRLTGRTSTV